MALNKRQTKVLKNESTLFSSAKKCALKYQRVCVCVCEVTQKYEQIFMKFGGQMDFNIRES